MSEKLAEERAKVAADIDQMTAELKGPMTNVERAWTVADRRDARRRLAELDAMLKAREGGTP